MIRQGCLRKGTHLNLKALAHIPLSVLLQLSGKAFAPVAKSLVVPLLLLQPA